MRSSFSSLALLVGAVLSACGPATADEKATVNTSAAAAGDAASTPQVAPVLRGTPDGPAAVWTFGTESELGYLSFAVPDTDIMPITLECLADRGDITARRSGGPSGLSQITFAQGDAELTVAGRSEETEIPEMPNFTSEVFSADSKVMQNFEESGSLRMIVAGDVYDLPSDEAGRGAVQAFFAHCSASPD